MPLAILNREPGDQPIPPGAPIWRTCLREVTFADDAQELARAGQDGLHLVEGEAYRLLTEAEWEYTAQAGSRAKYSWGDEISKNRANCNGCGSQWDSKRTAPTGSFAANAFGRRSGGPCGRAVARLGEVAEDIFHHDHSGIDDDAEIDGTHRQQIR